MEVTQKGISSGKRNCRSRPMGGELSSDKEMLRGVEL